MQAHTFLLCLNLYDVTARKEPLVLTKTLYEFEAIKRKSKRPVG